MIINAENLIIGRLASYAAKQALLGEQVDIINSEKAVITGDKQVLLADYRKKLVMGTPYKGPFFPRTPDKILKRTIRGMLPYKQPKGRNALKRIKCHIGAPDEIKGHPITIENANIKKTKSLRYISLEKLSKLLRGK